MKKSTQNLIIKSMHTNNGISVFVDQAGYVWIMGSNTNSCLGVETGEEEMDRAVRTSIHLEPEETIVQLYHCGLLTALYLSSKRLFISRVMEPNGFLGIRNKVGVYPGASHTPDAEPVHEEPTRETLPFDQEFNWPESIPISFSMPYAMYETKAEPAIESTSDELAELGLGPEAGCEPKLVPQTKAPVVRTVSKSKRSDSEDESESESESVSVSVEEIHPCRRVSVRGRTNADDSGSARGRTNADDCSDDDDDSSEDSPQPTKKSKKQPIATAKGKRAHVPATKKPVYDSKGKKKSKKEESSDDSCSSEPKSKVSRKGKYSKKHRPSKKE